MLANTLNLYTTGSRRRSEKDVYKDRKASRPVNATSTTSDSTNPIVSRNFNIGVIFPNSSSPGVNARIEKLGSPPRSLVVHLPLNRLHSTVRNGSLSRIDSIEGLAGQKNSSPHCGNRPSSYRFVGTPGGQRNLVNLSQYATRTSSSSSSSECARLCAERKKRSKSFPTTLTPPWSPRDRRGKCIEGRGCLEDNGRRSIESEGYN